MSSGKARYNSKISYYLPINVGEYHQTMWVGGSHIYIYSLTTCATCAEKHSNTQQRTAGVGREGGGSKWFKVTPTTFQLMSLINPKQAGEGANVSQIFSYEALGYEAID